MSSTMKRSFSGRYSLIKVPVLAEKSRNKQRVKILTFSGIWKRYVIAFKGVPWTLCNWFDTEARKIGKGAWVSKNGKFRCQARMFLSLVFRKKNWCSGWHVVEDFRLGGILEHVLRNASLLCCGAWVLNTTGHGGFAAFCFPPLTWMIFFFLNDRACQWRTKIVINLWGLAKEWLIKIYNDYIF